jgi:hypothetical protein
MLDIAMDHKAIDIPFNGCWAIVHCKFCGTFFTSMYSNNALKYFGAFWDSNIFSNTGNDMCKDCCEECCVPIASFE